jgi:hypothetical protein
LAALRNPSEVWAMGTAMKQKARSFTHTFPIEGAEPFTHTVTVLPEGADPKEFMKQVMHDCPDCQAALARGETPTVGTGEDLMRIARDYERDHSDPEPESRQVRRARERQIARMTRRRS